jgi:hypothetical protein
MYHIVYMFSLGHPYLPKSPVLILTRDSDNQTSEGEGEKFQESKTLFSSLERGDSRINLVNGRKAVFQHLRNTAITGGGYGEELFNGRNLKEGKDFFGTDTDARYLAAVDRYLGGVFRGLGAPGKKRIAHSLHHVLIVSAAYGLLKPFEPVQYCNYPSGDSTASYTLWNQDDRITGLLADYIRTYEIRRIFDFTGFSLPFIHGIFRWERITNLPRIEVLHAGHRWGRGDDALPFFGIFLRDTLLSARTTELLELHPDTWYSDIIFRHELQQDDEFSGLLARGESAGTEFKSRALWSLDPLDPRTTIPPSPEHIRYGTDASTFILAKTIAGFLNTDGGDLIIGLPEGGKDQAGDTGNGIEGDYRYLDTKGVDGYRAMLTDSVIRKYFDNDFFTRHSAFLSIRFRETGGKTLCWIHIKKSDRPIFLDAGNEVLFFVRTVTQTREIRKMNEIFRYTSQHFNQ